MRVTVNRHINPQGNWSGPQSGQGLGAKDRSLLKTLRRVGRICRVKARQDMFIACAVLSSDASVSLDTFVETLIRSLSESFGQQPTLYRLDETEVSFDEAWLLQLANAIARDDRASTDFLLRSRVRPHARRHIGFLMRSIDERSDMI